MKKFLFEERFKFSVVELVVFGIALRFSYQHSTLSNIIVVVGLVLLVGDWVVNSSRYSNGIWLWLHRNHGGFTSYAVSVGECPYWMCDHGHRKVFAPVTLKEMFPK